MNYSNNIKLILYKKIYETHTKDLYIMKNSYWKIRLLLALITQEEQNDVL